MKVYGSFLVFGAHREPAVVLLDETQTYALAHCLSFAEGRDDPQAARELVYADRFGPGTQYAIPCWQDGALLMVVEAEGQIDERVRQLAALIYSNKPYSRGRDLFESRDDEPKDGGTKVPKPKAPKPRGPRGSKLAPEFQAEVACNSI